MAPATRRVYVCSLNCGVAYHHPLKHCPDCPGKLEARELPWDWAKWPRGYFTERNGGQRYEEWLKNQGLHFPADEDA